jgi:hypothetical protein
VPSILLQKEHFGGRSNGQQVFTVSGINLLLFLFIALLDAFFISSSVNNKSKQRPSTSILV